MRNQLQKFNFEKGETKFLGGEGESIEMKLGTDTEYPGDGVEGVENFIIGSFLQAYKNPYSAESITGILLEDKLFFFF